MTRSTVKKVYTHSHIRLCSVVVLQEASNMLDENAGPSQANRAAGAGGKGGKKTIEQTYTKKSQLEHILLRPDTYSTFPLLLISPE